MRVANASLLCGSTRVPRSGHAVLLPFMETHRGPAASWGGLVARHRWAFLCGWVLAAAALAFFAASTPRHLSPAGFETDTEASHVEEFLRREFPLRASPVVF